MNASQTASLLERAAPYLRRPDGCSAGSNLESGVLDRMGVGPARRGAQLSLDRPSAAWFYARFRHSLIAWLGGLPSYSEECERLFDELEIAPGDVVLDLACGHGNFTAALAERVGPEGLVIGIDISGAMLALAVERMRQAALANVLLVWGDAHDLPIQDGSIAKLNCSGGFHSMPDLPRALGELARVAKPGARLTASTFAQVEGDPLRGIKTRLSRSLGAHFVSLEELGRQLEERGFVAYHARLHGRWLGYASARKAED